MKAFVTGGSGFIGRSLVRQLVEAGYDVHALARSEPSAVTVRALGATPVRGDVTEKETMRDSMTGSDVVFHLAGWHELGSADWATARTTNVDGTRNVLTLATQLGVPRIVYTSTVELFGDTDGQMVDETYFFDGELPAAYQRAKWLAHYRVALPLIRQGAPITIVMPGMVFGPGAHGLLVALMRLFLAGTPVLAGLDTTFCYVHVDDVARGHLLAAERGRPGETYILGGPAVPLDEMIDFWINLTGQHVPRTVHVRRVARRAAPLVDAAGSAMHLSPLFTEEALRMMGYTYIVSSVKAETELGWQMRPLQAGMLETLRWVEETHPPVTLPVRPVALAGAAAVGGAAAWWLLRSRRQEENGETAGEATDDA